MAIKTIEVIIDDKDGKELPQGTKPVQLSWNGTTWNLYLSKANQESLNKVITDWTENAQTVKGRVSAPKAGRSDAKQIREWAAANNIEVPARGRIPKEVVEAYDAR